MRVLHFVNIKAGRLRNGTYYISNDLNTLLKARQAIYYSFLMKQNITSFTCS